MPGDELVGYTYIPPEFEVCEKEVETETVSKAQVHKLSGSYPQEVGDSSATTDVIETLRSYIIQYVNDPLNTDTDTDIDLSLRRNYSGCKS